MIKILACIFMVIDHMGLILFPQNIIFRLIGRLSMPLFAYNIACGFFYTKKRGTFGKYLKRLGVFTLSIQVPYSLYNFANGKGFYGCILVLWFFSLCFLYFFDKEDKTDTDGMFMFMILLITLMIPMDYGTYGLVMVLLLYCFEIKKRNVIVLFIGFILDCYIISLTYGVTVAKMQLLTIFCIPIIILFKNYDNKIKLSKYFFYVFYPLHIIILFFIKIILNLI